LLVVPHNLRRGITARAAEFHTKERIERKIDRLEERIDALTAKIH
jgi:hypothetical protein